VFDNTGGGEGDANNGLPSNMDPHPETQYTRVDCRVMKESFSDSGCLMSTG